MTGLYRRALNAAMYSFDRTRGRPSRKYATPCAFPLSTECGATPASEAICLAFSRTSFFDGNKPVHKHVLRRFGQVPDAYLKETTGE